MSFALLRFSGEMKFLIYKTFHCRLKLIHMCFPLWGLYSFHLYNIWSQIILSEKDSNVTESKEDAIKLDGGQTCHVLQFYLSSEDRESNIYS